MGAGTTAGAEAIAAAEKNADVLAARAAIGDPSAFPSIYRIPAAMLYTSGMVERMSRILGVPLPFSVRFGSNEMEGKYVHQVGHHVMLLICIF